MIDDMRLRDLYGLAEHEAGDQSLLWPEILAAVHPYRRFAIPTRTTAILAHMALHHQVYIAHYDLSGKELDQYLPGADVIYAGTPTIVDDRPLFYESWMGDYWTKGFERQRVRELAKLAERHGYKRLITGLGSGDISPDERIIDMGPGTEMIAYKRFEDWEDWLFVRQF